MSKVETEESQYLVRWETHSKYLTSILCSLMEHQSLVDVAICCGTNTIHAHKCILACNSQYFREQLEKNLGIEQIIVNGVDFTVLKSIIEYMYSGVTQTPQKNIKYMIAAAKFFQIRGLQVLADEQPELRYEADLIHIPPPVFLTKKPKYPNSYRPINSSPSDNYNNFKTPITNDFYVQRKVKRRLVRTEADKACAREAAASRLALETLQREIAAAPEVNSFVIEESCTETTVENFIPESDETYMDNLDQIDNVSQLEVVNFDDLNNSFVNNQMMDLDKPDAGEEVLQFDVPENSTKDKLKHMLGADIPNNVEIMFRTSEGHFVNVTDDVLQNLSEGSLQYQIVDENGHLGEIRSLNVMHQDQSLPTFEETPNVVVDNSILQESTDGFVSNYNNDDNQVLQNSITENDNTINEPNSEYVVSTQNSVASNMNISETKLDETDAFIDALRTCESNNTTDLYRENIFDRCSDVSEMKDLTNSDKDENTNTSQTLQNFEPPPANAMYLSDSQSDMNRVIDLTYDINDNEGAGDSCTRDKPVVVHSPRKTRSTFNTDVPMTIENNTEAQAIEETFTVKNDKPRRIMPSRKKKHH